MSRNGEFTEAHMRANKGLEHQTQSLADWPVSALKQGENMQAGYAFSGDALARIHAVRKADAANAQRKAKGEARRAARNNK